MEVEGVRRSAKVAVGTGVAIVWWAMILMVFVLVRRKRLNKKRESRKVRGSVLAPTPIPVEVRNLSPQPMVAPLRTRGRGLLERRGSSASLRIDLSSSDAPVAHPSPLKERSFEESTTSKHNRLSRSDLRHMNVRECLPAIFSEFGALSCAAESCRAKVAGCSQKNRHHVWPIRETRVRIWDNNAAEAHTSMPAGSAECESRSYINANYISDENSTRLYIAAEGPMPNTTNDFWAMVWQEKSVAVVMLTNLDEAPGKNKRVERKCEKYWPDKEARYGLINVRVLCIKSYNGVQVRDIFLQRGLEEHRLRHYWFTKWFDHRLPIGHTMKVLRLVATVEKFREDHRNAHGASGPVVVHCSAGIGRTCTFIGISMGVQQLCASMQVDVLAIVSRLRTQRYGAVQRPEQYAFIYLALQKIERLLPDSAAQFASDFLPRSLCFSESSGEEEEEEASEDENNSSDESMTSSSELLNSGF